jgi:hypothetical protein
MKPANKIRRREARAQRRLEWGAARAVFLLAGGHKDWITPFHMDWRTQMPQQTASVERGDTYFTQPRNFYHGNITPTGNISSNIPSHWSPKLISKFWQQTLDTE